MRGILIFVSLTMLSAGVAWGVEEPFYKESDRPGFWWKNDPVEEQKPEPAKKPKAESKKPTETAKAPRYPKLSDYSTEELYDMHPDQFVELTDDFKKQAVQRPTEENLYGYLKMQDIAVRKAVAFDNVARVTMQKNPELTLENDMQDVGPGAEIDRANKQNELESAVKNAAREFGLLYFSKKGCKYCAAQDDILRYLTARGWNVKRIDVDKDPVVAETFNITVTPSLLMVQNGGSQALPISYGVIPYTELRQRIRDGVLLMKGVVTPEQYGISESQRGGGFDPMAPVNKGRNR